jgi:hypothetical protein
MRAARNMLTRALAGLAVAIAVALLTACGTDDATEPRETEPASAIEPADPADPADPAETHAMPAGETPLIEVTAFDYAFAAPDEIASGWTTFQLNNERAQEVHELSLAKLPEGRTHDDYVAEVIPVWGEILQEFQSGTMDRDAIYAAANERLPAWAADIRYVHSRGLVSPGRTSWNTLRLDAGNYSLDCWVKAPDGHIHISHGMTRALTVTDEDSGGSPPEPDLEITLSGNGIVAQDVPVRGHLSVAVQLEEGPDGSPVVGDLHLVRVEDDTDLAEVARWLDWYQPGGVQAPAPADFIGGFDTYGSMPDDGRAHFGVDVNEPGNYAWIVNAPPEDELWQTFTVE